MPTFDALNVPVIATSRRAVIVTVALRWLWRRTPRRLPPRRTRSPGDARARPEPRPAARRFEQRDGDETRVQSAPVGAHRAVPRDRAREVTEPPRPGAPSFYILRRRRRLELAVDARRLFRGASTVTDAKALFLFFFLYHVSRRHRPDRARRPSARACSSRPPPWRTFGGVSLAMSRERSR